LGAPLLPGLDPNSATQALKLGLATGPPRRKVLDEFRLYWPKEKNRQAKYSNRFAASTARTTVIWKVRNLDGPSWAKFGLTWLHVGFLRVMLFSPLISPKDLYKTPCANVWEENWNIHKQSWMNAGIMAASCTIRCCFFKACFTQFSL
jgi:hypothetical protein